MQFSAQQVNAMSLWQYAAALDGYVRGQGGGDKAEAPTDDEFMAWIKGEA